MHSSKEAAIYLILTNPIYLGSNSKISEVSKMTDPIKMYLKN